MQYSLIIVVRDGQPDIDGADNLPDGTFVISGGEDDQHRHIAISRKHTDGRYAESASHSHPKEA